MARNCSICSDPRLSEIDAALLGTEAYRSISKQFSLSESAVYRHKKDHLPVVLGREMEAAGLTPAGLLGAEISADGESGDQPAHAVLKSGVDGDSLVNHLGELHTSTLSILKDSMEAGRSETGLKAVREARQNVELVAKLAGLLPVEQQFSRVGIFVLAPALGITFDGTGAVVAAASEPEPKVIDVTATR